MIRRYASPLHQHLLVVHCTLCEGIKCHQHYQPYGTHTHEGGYGFWWVQVRV